MKYDELKAMPASDRPRKLSLPWERQYFEGKALIYFLAIALLLTVNAFLASWVRSSLIPIASILLGLPFWAAIHVTLQSGFSSSNFGTYFKEKEPNKYTRDLVVMFTCLTLITTGSWIASI